ncbi:MAG: hypothetical protein HC911_01195 [Chloroflexaceae bacterium]|nr:hypothetical protein [Chloroflexaceae bacterium]
MTSFHVRHDFSPIIARHALLLLRMAKVSSEEALLEQARARDLDIGRRQSVTKVFASLRALGLIEPALAEQRGQVRLTDLGRQLADVAVHDALLFAELIHLRYWWLWQPEQDRAHFAWSYRTIATILWDEAPVTIDRNRLVTMVLVAAEHQFGISGISFSTSSVSGILHWLRVISPPCIIGNTFRRRPTCPPEALVVALEGIATARGHPVGTPLRLDAATREHVCHSTLLEEEAMDEVLQQAEKTLGVIRRSGDGGETVLIREPLFPALIPQMEY